MFTKRAFENTRYIDHFLRKKKEKEARETSIARTTESIIPRSSQNNTNCKFSALYRFTENNTPTLHFRLQLSNRSAKNKIWRECLCGRGGKFGFEARLLTGLIRPNFSPFWAAAPAFKITIRLVIFRNKAPHERDVIF